MEIIQTIKKEIIPGTLVQINGLYNDFIVVDIKEETSEDRVRGDTYNRTIMECININELKLSNPQVYKFNIKDLGCLSGEKEIHSSDISIVGFQKIQKIVTVQYNPE